LEEAGLVELSLFPFDLFVVCTTAYHVVCHSFLCAGLRESVSNCNFVWRDLVFLSCTRVEGYPSDLVLKSSGPITFDSRSGVSSFAQVLVLGFLWFLSVHRRSRGGGS